jgi:hypothetical protein
MSIQTIAHDLLLKISTYLTYKDIAGFAISNTFMNNTMLWAYDDFGVHLCLCCDLTISMRGAYQHLKQYLLQTIEELNANPTIGRTLVSSVFYWDFERAYDGKPYVQIQTPSQNFAKQKRLITYANIDSGGGAECGGIALCELDMQFTNKWINQHGGKFNKSMDIVLMCLDAPFHFMVDQKNYHKKARKQAINTDWIAAMHSLYKRGVMIIMIIIDTQPQFTQSLQLIGGFNNALGGISITITTSCLEVLPKFVHAIINEETQRKKHIYNIYKQVAYKHKHLNPNEIYTKIIQELESSNIEIQCANIPEHIIISADNTPNARELASCKTMKEAIDAGILESEAVTERLLHNLRHPQYDDPPIAENKNNNNDMTFMPVITLKRQLTQAPFKDNKHKLNNITRESTLSFNHKIQTQPIKKVKFANQSVNKQIINTFGLIRQQSASAVYAGKLFNGSIKCYFKNPNVDFSKITNKLHSLSVSNTHNSEQKFIDALKINNINQYNLYMNGGLLGRFNNDEYAIQNNTVIPTLSNLYNSDGMIHNIPLLIRSISDNCSLSTNARLLNNLC